jgi:alkanesulfonate monooxygenase SsuD/methylene tetrahydromethanopterin reductase-like flavin-dependent oxidoreductase (luciferase family)
MKYGVHLPNFGSFGDVYVLIDLARTAENAGWDGFFLWDHLLFCELDKNPHADPWITLAAIAVQTERIHIGAMVTPLARRRPQKLARETVTLQNLSNGRLIVGAGLGDPVEWDFTTFHEESDPKIRAQKLDEGLDILTQLWSGETVNYEGEHYQISDATFLPKPIQPIPIWIAGYYPRHAPMRRAARFQGMFPGHVDGKLLPEHIKAIRAYIEQHREHNSPYDIVAGGRSKDSSDTAEVAEYRDAGLTWWIEDISPLRLGYGWQDLWKAWDIDALKARIAAGAPRV